jgi:hypothetical protein
MSKIIIGIHGLGNKPPEKTLDVWWKAALREGLMRVDSSRRFFNFEMAYWASYLHPEPLNPRIKDKKNPLYIEDPYIRAPRDSVIEIPGELRHKIVDYLDRQLEKIFLNDDFSINYAAVTDFIIHHFFSDLETYYNDHCVIQSRSDCLAKDVIRNDLADMLKKHRRKKIMLVAHSMGSIIAYDVLTQYVSDIEIDTFITLGSPLGSPVIKSKIAAEQKNSHPRASDLKTPENIKNYWYNFSDIKDKIVINARLSDDFAPNSRAVRPIDHIVVNDYAYKDEANPHKAFGYLRTPELSQIIRLFLGTRRDTPLGWIKKAQQHLHNRFKPDS